MTVLEYYSLPNTQPLAQGSIALARTKLLLAAVASNRDCSLIETRGVFHEDGSSLEVIVMDLCCDGVPSNSAVRYRERIALCIPSDSARLPEVLALRLDFPALPHQNVTPPDFPRSLCLYSEPARAVLRTWTAQNYLARIQWWLETSAKGMLHAGDQALERLFFTTQYDLVLPPDTEECIDDRNKSLVITGIVDGPNGTKTLRSCFAPKSNLPPGVPRIAAITVTLPETIHGQLEAQPQTLGQLATTLERRNLDLTRALSEELARYVGDGMRIEAMSSACLLLVRFPVVRCVGGVVERWETDAFFIDENPLTLGEKLRALFTVDQQHFYVERSLALETALEAKWRTVQVHQAEVSSPLSAELARRFSGVEEKGPLGTLVGAGSLGSALLNFWIRSGWGTWTVIDEDRVKPHNLSRHLAFDQDIGKPKVVTVSELMAATGIIGSPVEAITANAIEMLADKGSKIRTGELTVDATADLDYPRAASDQRSIGRHCSVFVTPSGNDAVLLFEDAERSVTLRSLEAQYYRAIINEAWGNDHLKGHTGRFWSGAGCRDISTVLPYSRILVHAATLSEQVRGLASKAHASIRVWRRESESGNVALFVVDTHREIELEIEGYRVFYDFGFEMKLREMREAKLPTETGGVLLGFYDMNLSTVTLVDALPAPSDSKEASASFERGTEGLRYAVQRASELTGNVVRYLGEWHSHPPHHSAAPSSNDIMQLAFLAEALAIDGLPAFSLIVGESEMQILVGETR